MPRKDGLLAEDQMRGIDPNYRYSFKGYPKALYPQPVTVASVEEEKRLRAKWKMPLPWTHAQEQKQRDEYWAMQEYPKEMQPPHVTVESPDEEAAVLASWNVRSARSHSDEWPHWMFHAKQPARMVMSLAELESMGAGWYDTPDQAIAAATGNVPRAVAAPVATPKTPDQAPARKMRSVLEPEVPQVESDPDRMNRTQMFAFLKEKGIAAKVPVSNDELRARVKAALMSQTEAA